jgi:hypothetical protein
MKRIDPCETADGRPMPRGRGHRLPETLVRLAERDRLLREVAEIFFPGLSARQQAQQVHDALRAYASTAWRRERTLLECPRRHAGKISAHLWAILAAYPSIPAPITIRLRALAAIKYPRTRSDIGASKPIGGPHPCS